MINNDLCEVFLFDERKRIFLFAPRLLKERIIIGDIALIQKTEDEFQFQMKEGDCFA